jgi:membrane glycosyltransferase
MSYVSALLWFIFLSISTAESVSQAVYGPDYFLKEGGLFPDWPIWNLGWAITLLVSTVIILFLPKLFSLILITFKQKQAKLYGGFFRLLTSVGAEVVFSMFLAPLRMLAHSKFVFATLLGRNVQWNPLPHEDSNTSWAEAFRFHGRGMLLALVWGAVVFATSRPFFWWLTPILIPLILAVPISVLTSRATIGKMFRRLGLFLIPEEISPPHELLMLNLALQGCPDGKRRERLCGHTGFVQAVVDPLTNGLHLAFRRDKRRMSEALVRRRRLLIQKALADGPEKLGQVEKMALLGDPTAVSELHQRVWELPDGGAARRWGLSQ